MEHYSYHKHFKTDTCNTVQWGKLFKWVGTSYGDITTIEEYSKLMVGTVCHSYAIDVWVGVARGFYDPRHSVFFINNIIKQGMQNCCQTLFIRGIPPRSFADMTTFSQGTLGMPEYCSGDYTIAI